MTIILDVAYDILKKFVVRDIDFELRQPIFTFCISYLLNDLGQIKFSKLLLVHL